MNLELELNRLESENELLESKIIFLRRDLDRKHRECAEFQRQCLVLSEAKQWIVDYAVWQAIHDLESRCRHYPTGLEVTVKDKAHDIPVQNALRLLELVGVEMVKNDHFPNVKIVYDRSQNPLFGKS